MREQLVTLRIEMRELSDSQQALVQKNENLKNRLELLEDRQAGLDLSRSVRSRAPLPVVRVQPKAAPRPAAAQSVITQADLDRLSQGQTTSKGVAKTRRRRAIPPPPMASQAGNVGVKPLPARPKFRRSAASNSADVTTATPAVGGPSTDEQDPIAEYKRGEALFTSGNLSASLKALENFTRRWPQHGYADNALRLRGEGRFKRAEYRAALKLFKTVLSKYPEGSEVPSALLMIGLTYDRLGRTEQALSTLERLRMMFPATAAGQRASRELKTLRRRK